MSARHVERNTRRARTGIEGYLQVFDIGVESRGIQRHAVTERRLEPGFVVPHLLIAIRLEAAEDRLVLRRTQRLVERVVDAAQTEALRYLCVQCHRVTQVVARHHARSEAVGCGRVGLVVPVGEQAAREETTRLVEVVPATTRRELQCIGDIEAHLTKHGNLVDVVGQIRVVR